MKLLIALVAFASLAVGQSAPEPDIADIFYRLEGERLVQLERQGAATQTGAHGFIVMTMKSSAEFPGGKSPVRFKAGEPLTFIVRSAIPIGSIDPNTIYHLRRLVAKKKTRELVTMSGNANPFGVSTKINGTTGLLPVEFSKYGDHSLMGADPIASPWGICLQQVRWCGVLFRRGLIGSLKNHGGGKSCPTSLSGLFQGPGADTTWLCDLADVPTARNHIRSARLSRELPRVPA